MFILIRTSEKMEQQEFVKEQPIESNDEVSSVVSSDESDGINPYAFNLKEYENKEASEYDEYRRTYAQKLCERYLETIDRRKQKMVLRNISVLDGMNVSTPKNPTTQDIPRPVPNTPFSWKSSQPITVEPQPVEIEPPVTQPLLVSKKKNKSPSKNKEKVVVESEQTITDEEMVQALSKKSKPSSQRNQKSPAKSPSLHTKPEFHPVPQQSVVQPQEKSPSHNKVKTRMCNFAERCRRPECDYAHTLEEYSPIECKFRTCRKPECRFYHPSTESKSEFLVRFRSHVQPVSK